MILLFQYRLSQNSSNLFQTPEDEQCLGHELWWNATKTYSYSRHLSLVVRVTERPVAALEGDERVDEALGGAFEAVKDLLKI